MSSTPTISVASQRRIVCDGTNHQNQVLAARRVDMIHGEWDETWEERGIKSPCDCDWKDPQ